MAPTLVLVAGLPGSGKSHLSDAAARERACRACHDFLADARRGIRRILDELAAGRDVVANDCALWTATRTPAWVEAEVVGPARDLGADVVLRSFENDPIACLRNVLRDHGRRRDTLQRAGYILDHRRSYEPRGEVLAVWDGAAAARDPDPR